MTENNKNKNKINIGVMGAGTWGAALARLLYNNGHDVTVWSALPDEVKLLSETRVHPNLKGMVIPDDIVFTNDIEQAVRGKKMLVVVTPSIFVRSTAEKMAQFVNNDQIIVVATKGMEDETLLTMTDIMTDVFKKYDSSLNLPVVALSGPTHAEEVALDLPTTIVSASKDLKTAEFVQDVFMNDCLRVYTNNDIDGVELCGALKNIVAIAVGISTGLGFGDNAKAAIITRGLAEISRLGLAMGCVEQTFSGLAGIGDLIVTATSVHSRNNKAGFLIGQGLSPKEAIEKVGMVVEGINALPSAVKLSKKYNIEMPIIMAVNSIVFENVDPKKVVTELMTRDKKNELVSE